MVLIEQIEIKYFRSFSDKIVKILNLKDLNIFSGSNDVGKSNVLKALNLFFNNEIVIGEKFSLNRDLSFIQAKRSTEKLKTRKDKQNNASFVTQRDLFVSIKIFFNRSVGKNSTSPEKFWISKKWKDDGYTINSNIETAYKSKNKKDPSKKQAAALQGQITRFLGSIYFEYIPAVKDRKYLKYLFDKLQKSLFERDKSFKTTSKNLNTKIKNTTEDLFYEFKQKTGIEAEFSIPETLIDFFSTINVSTENGVSLYSRGDGMQARFIPAILNEISKGKKYVFWGFEEPENSYEYSASEKLANDFLNEYSQNKQIFITSHTKEFLSLIKDNESNVSLYRVYQTFKNGSQIDVYKKGIGFDKDKIKKKIVGSNDISQLGSEKKNVLNKIFEDIGFLETDQYIVEDLQNQLKETRRILDESGLDSDKQKQIIESQNSRIRKLIIGKEDLEKVIKEFSKPILYVEDKYDHIYKIAFLKLNSIDFNYSNINEKFNEKCNFQIFSKNSSKELNKWLDMVEISDQIGKMIIGLFDFDSAFGDFNGLKKEKWTSILGDDNTGLYRSRKDHNNFHSLLLPVPEHRGLYASKKSGAKSTLCIELYFTDDTLRSLGNLGEEPIPGVSEKRKIFIGKKNKFWQKIIDLDQSDFKHFKLLLNAIERLFDIRN